MELNKLTNLIENKIPLSLQEEWDNSGLLIKTERDIKQIMICLDITSNIVDYAVANDIDLIISHHPLIFGDYFDNYEYVRLNFHRLRAHKIAVYSMHTNYDNYEYGTNYQFAKQLMYEKKLLPNDDMTIKYFNSNDDLLKLIKKLYKVDLRVYNYHQPIKKVGVVLGAGGSFLEQAKAQGCDTFISSEFKHHQILFAMENKMTLIDVGHQLEKIITPNLAKFISSLDNSLMVTAYNDLYKMIDI
jgi:GTP cyclohydrolase I